MALGIQALALVNAVAAAAVSEMLPTGPESKRQHRRKRTAVAAEGHL